MGDGAGECMMYTNVCMYASVSEYLYECCMCVSQTQHHSNGELDVL